MDDIKTTPLGHVFTPKELKQQCKKIYGGVSWPGKQPGFVVVIGMSHNRSFENYEICQLDEVESKYLRKIVRQCGDLDFKYQPDVWYGDNRYNAAEKFICEMNKEYTSSVNSQEHHRHFSVHSTHILEMSDKQYDAKEIYPYILESIRELLDKDPKQLFLKKESKILGYLNNIPENTSALKFGDYPAVEALAFAVLEMRLCGAQLVENKKPRPDKYDKEPGGTSDWAE